MAVLPPIPEPREPGRPEGGDGRSQPLSGRERQSLAELEARLSAEEPLLSARVGRARPGLLDGVDSRTLNRAVQALVVLALVVVILPGPWVGTLLMVLIIGGCMAAALRTIRRGEP